MGEIKKVKVGDLVINFDRYRKPLSNRQREKMKGSYPYYGAACVFDYVNDYIFDGDYILLGEDGTVINDNGTPVLQRISGKTWVNNHAHVLKNSSLIDFDYLYYTLKNANFRGAVTGAVQPKISQANMNAVEVFIHEDIQEQRKIASVLLALDHKIELNNKINDNLSFHNPTDLTSISPDNNLGNNKSLKSDRRSFSKPFLKITSKAEELKLLNFSNNSSGGMDICSLLINPFKSKFLIPVVPFSYIKNKSLSYKYCQSVYKNSDQPFLGVTARQKLVQTKPLLNLDSNISEIYATRPVDCVGLPPEISTTRSPSCNFLAS